MIELVRAAFSTSYKALSLRHERPSVHFGSDVGNQVTQLGGSLKL
jgi:hypothetical protein